jgi:hypothetical protein
MSTEGNGWRDDAFEAYRQGWTALRRWQDRETDRVLLHLEDLREALLDLKQATIEEDQARAIRHTQEVKMIIAELLLLEGE